MFASKITKVVGGRLEGGDVEVSGYTHDSREIKKGNCFFALTCDGGDGHSYLESVKESGGVCAVVEKQMAVALPQIVVKDSLKALQDLALYHRKHYNLPIIALTGSCGKTTVKEMVASILPKPSLATPGNYNNHIGVPLSLLRLNETHQFAVFELGANHIGEIASLVRLVLPDVAYINNIAPAHLEGFGSIDGVLKAKSEIFSGLASTGTAVINIDDERLAPLVHQLPNHMLTCATYNSDADIYASDSSVSDTGCYTFILNLKGKRSNRISLSVPGEHNLANAVAAAALCYAVGVSDKDIAIGLSQFKGVKGRLTEHLSQSGIRVLDDTYNANLRSVKAAIDVLANFAGRRVFILGDLAEVGDDLDKHYQQIAEHLNQKEIDYLLTCGAMNPEAFRVFKHDKKHFNDKQAMADAMNLLQLKETTILVKGSRSAKMEEVVTKLLEQ